MLASAEEALLCGARQAEAGSEITVFWGSP